MSRILPAGSLLCVSRAALPSNATLTLEVDTASKSNTCIRPQQTKKQASVISTPTPDNATELRFACLQLEIAKALLTEANRELERTKRIASQELAAANARNAALTIKTSGPTYSKAKFRSLMVSLQETKTTLSRTNTELRDAHNAHWIISGTKDAAIASLTEELQATKAALFSGEIHQLQFPTAADRVEYETFEQSSAWRRMRASVLRVQGECCANRYCGYRHLRNQEYHVDHIKPKADYWHLRLETANLQVLCAPCNLSKGTKPQAVWQREQKHKYFN